MTTKHSAPVSAPLEEAWTLPASWYVDAAHHERELRALLSRGWHYACPVDDVAAPGAFVTLEVCGEPLVVVRGDDGAVRAFFNVCRHRAGQVAKGAGCAPALKCHYHGWTYALDGALCGAPEMQEARNFEHAQFALRPARCAVWSRFVFVNVDDGGPSLADVLGAAGRERTFSHAVEGAPFTLRQSWDIACNWKVYVDNFLEGYHVPRAHPSLHALLDYKSYVVEPAGDCVVQRAPARIAAAPGASYLWMFPAFMLNVTPQYTQTNAIVPLSVERTRVVFDFFFAPGVSQRQRAEALQLSDEIQREDIELCETVQRNLRSRSYDAGRYCPRRENGVHHFHQLVRAALARS